MKLINRKKVKQTIGMRLQLGCRAARDSVSSFRGELHSLESELSEPHFSMAVATSLKSSMMLFNPIKYPSSWLPTSQFFLWVILMPSGTGPVFAKSISQQLACFRSWRNNSELPIISCDLKNSECSKVARMALRRCTYRGCGEKRLRLANFSNSRTPLRARIGLISEM